MTGWQPMATAPRDGKWVILQLEGDREVRAQFFAPRNDWLLEGKVTMPCLDAWPLAWRPVPACAACGAGPADARLGPAGSEYWPERRAELTCDACAERLTLAAERFRRIRGWSALQERLADLAMVASGKLALLGPAAGLEAARREERRRAAITGARTDDR